MNIKLQKSLVIFDLEATGLNVTHDRIVEIAAVKIAPDGSTTNFDRRLNPEMPIPAEVSEIHGIYDADIADAPTFKDVLPELEAFLQDCDFAGYNSSKFDLPMLAEEMLRAESAFDLSESKHIDVQNIFHKMEQRTLVAAYKFYCQKDLNNAHNAMADAQATWEVLDEQIAHYDDLANDVDSLAEFSRYNNMDRADFAGRLGYNKEGEVTYNFGKNKNRTIAEVHKTEPGYYGWMIDADFPLYTKQVLRKEMTRIKELNAPPAKNFDDKLSALQNKFKK